MKEKKKSPFANYDYIKVNHALCPNRYFSSHPPTQPFVELKHN